MRGDARLDRRILSKRKLELHNGVRFFRGLVKDRLRNSTRGSDHLTREIPFAVVIIATVSVGVDICNVRSNVCNTVACRVVYTIIPYIALVVNKNLPRRMPWEGKKLKVILF